MAKKRKRARNPKKKHRKTARRAAAANPAKRTRKRARARTSNPKRSYARRASKRNPSRKRARRRNPFSGGGGGGKLSLVKLFAPVAAGAVAFGAVQALGYLAPGDPVANGMRNRLIAAAVGVGAALYLAKKKKADLAVAVAGGAVLGAIGGNITVQVFKHLPPKKAPGGVAAVFADNMAAVQTPMMGIGDYNQIGELAPPAPWTVPTPFG